MWPTARLASEQYVKKQTKNTGIDWAIYLFSGSICFRWSSTLEYDFMIFLVTQQQSTERFR